MVSFRIIELFGVITILPHSILAATSAANEDAAVSSAVVGRHRLHKEVNGSPAYFVGKNETHQTSPHWWTDIEGSTLRDLRGEKCVRTPIRLKVARIGEPARKGRVRRLGANIFALKGGGRSNTQTYSSFGLTDDFLFAYKKMRGNIQIIARMTTVGMSDGKAGIMVRDSLKSNAANIFAQSSIGVTEFWQVVRGDRPNTGGGTSNLRVQQDTGKKSVWLRIDRNGSSLVAYYAVDNGCSPSWIQMSPQNPVTIPMADPCYVGLAVTSLEDDALEKAAFDNIQIRKLRP